MGWAGSGSNTAYVAMDFSTSTEESVEFVFGVRFDGDSITSTEALNILDTELDDLITTVSASAWGSFLDEIAFTYGEHVFTQPDDAYWHLFTSADFGQSWDSSMVGMNDRVLSDGDTDGWLADDLWDGTTPNGPRLGDLETRIAADVVAWAGSGSNTAYVAMDFSTSAEESVEFVFGVRFDGASITSAEALNILDTELDDLVTTVTISAWGSFLDEISFTYGEHVFTQPDGAYWHLLTSSVFGQEWVSSWIGMNDRILLDGDTDGWLADDLWDGTTPNGPRLGDLETRIATDVVAWAGSGSNTAYVVVDFDVSPTESLEVVFGIRFSEDSIASEEALILLREQTDLTVILQESGFGTFLESLAWPAHGREFTESDSAYWHLFTSSVYGNAWVSSPVGMSDRILTNGDTDGWLADSLWDGTTPNGPRIYIPEPASARHWDSYE